jgi:DNA-binding PadR family transcriptional regulator
MDKPLVLAGIPLTHYGVTRYSASRCSKASQWKARMNKTPEPTAPLTPAMFHVLLALAGDDLHGYAILKEVALRTGWEVQLSTGTLYGIIKRLLNDGLITERRERPAAIHDDERRRYYRLTSKGRDVAAAEAERLEKVVALARSRRLLKKTQLA